MPNWALYTGGVPLGQLFRRYPQGLAGLSKKNQRGLSGLSDPAPIRPGHLTSQVHWPGQATLIGALMTMITWSTRSVNYCKSHVSLFHSYVLAFARPIFITPHWFPAAPPFSLAIRRVWHCRPGCSHRPIWLLKKERPFVQLRGGSRNSQKHLLEDGHKVHKSRLWSCDFCFVNLVFLSLTLRQQKNLYRPHFHWGWHLLISWESQLTWLTVATWSVVFACVGACVGVVGCCCCCSCSCSCSCSCCCRCRCRCRCCCCFVVVSVSVSVSCLSRFQSQLRCLCFCQTK